jgi:hypothetical protein|tara:strand:- start:2037 stop:2213 length:177 start_codon:yes stop_codon:yes gene_type:complete
MRLNEKKVGDVFKMTGMSAVGKEVLVEATLIEDEDRNYVVKSKGVRILCDGYEMVYPK